LANIHGEHLSGQAHDVLLGFTEADFVTFVSIRVIIIRVARDCGEEVLVSEGAIIIRVARDCGEEVRDGFVRDFWQGLVRANIPQKATSQ
jgi:hypothetical protein